MDIGLSVASMPRTTLLRHTNLNERNAKCEASSRHLRLASRPTGAFTLTSPRAAYLNFSNNCPSQSASNAG
jgi:hypothetical protein